MNIQDWFSLGLTGLISLQFKGISRVFSNTIIQKHQFFRVQPSLWSNSHPYMTTGKPIALTTGMHVGKVMSLLFSTMSRFVIASLPRSKCLLISWLQSFWSTRKENLSLVALFPFYLPWSDRTGCHDPSFLNVEFQASFFTLSPLSRVPLHFLPVEWYCLHIWDCWCFS